MIGFFTREQVHSTMITKGSRSCFSCGLLKGNDPLEPYGNFRKKIMIIGEYAGTQDIVKRIPWQGKDGRLLQKMLKSLGVDLFEDCVSLYSVFCNTENKKPTGHQIDCCSVVKVLKTIKKYEPKVVLLLGDIPLISFIGPRWNKSLGGIVKWRGWTIPNQEYNTWICPTFAPEYIGYMDTPEVKVTWRQDFKRAFQLGNLPKFKEPNIHYIDDLSVLDNIKSGVVAFDYETTGIKPYFKGHHIVCVSIAYDQNNVYVFILPKKKSRRAPFIRFLKNKKIKKIASNMKYEDQWSFVKLGTKVKGWFHDTMLTAHLLDYRPGISGLKFQSFVKMGIVGYEEEVDKYITRSREKGNRSNAINMIDELLKQPGGTKELLKYCALDSIYEYRLAEMQIKQIEQRSDAFLTAYKLIHNGILALARAERQGIRVNMKYAKKQKGKLTKIIDKLIASFENSNFYKYWQHSSGKNKVNINSNYQLSTYLYKVKKIKPSIITPSGQGSTGDEALKALGIPELDILLRIRKLKKLRDTYLKAFIQESSAGYIHPIFNLHTVATYRSSSDSPNFQNIPIRDPEAKKIIRGCLFPRPGHQLIEIDFSGLEVAIAACYHKDPTMIKYIKDPTTDMHGDMAKQIFLFGKEFDKSKEPYLTLRNGAKNGFVFPQFYGDYYGNNAVGLSQWAQLPLKYKYKESDGLELPNGINLGGHLINKGIRNPKEFIEHLKEIENHFWNKRFPVYNLWKKKWWVAYQKNGYFDMLTGFRCTGIMGKNDVINYPVQGSAFHCLLWSFIELDKVMRKEKWDTRLIGQIHDSILFDVLPEERDHIIKVAKRITEVDLIKEWSWINVPLKIDIELAKVDESWLTKIDLKEYLINEK